MMVMTGEELVGEFTSALIAFPLKVTVPANIALYESLNLTVFPGARFAKAGDGHLNNAAQPVPLTSSDEGRTPVTVAEPVFVTTIFMVKVLDSLTEVLATVIEELSGCKSSASVTVKVCPAAATAPVRVLVLELAAAEWSAELSPELLMPPMPSRTSIAIINLGFLIYAP
jgi:hypothetical protein